MERSPHSPSARTRLLSSPLLAPPPHHREIFGMAAQRHPTIHKADARAQRVRQRKTHAVCRSLPNTDAAMRTDAHARRVTRLTLLARRDVNCVWLRIPWQARYSSYSTWLLGLTAGQFCSRKIENDGQSHVQGLL